MKNQFTYLSLTVCFLLFCCLQGLNAQLMDPCAKGSFLGGASLPPLEEEEIENDIPFDTEKIFQQLTDTVYYNFHPNLEGQVPADILRQMEDDLNFPQGVGLSEGEYTLLLKFYFDEEGWMVPLCLNCDTMAFQNDLFSQIEQIQLREGTVHLNKPYFLRLLLRVL